MSDKVVLDQTLAKLKKLEIIGFTFCGDRGFFSERNLKMLTDSGVRFTIPVPSSIKWGKELIKEHRDSLIHPSHFINDEKTRGSLSSGKRGISFDGNEGGSFDGNPGVTLIREEGGQFARDSPLLPRIQWNRSRRSDMKNAG